MRSSWQVVSGASHNPLPSAQSPSLGNPPAAWPPASPPRASHSNFSVSCPPLLKYEPNCLVSSAHQLGKNLLGDDSDDGCELSGLRSHRKQSLDGTPDPARRSLLPSFFTEGPHRPGRSHCVERVAGDAAGRGGDCGAWQRHGPREGQRPCHPCWADGAQVGICAWYCRS